MYVSYCPAVCIEKVFSLSLFLDNSSAPELHRAAGQHLIELLTPSQPFKKETIDRYRYSKEGGSAHIKMICTMCTLCVCKDHSVKIYPLLKLNEFTPHCRLPRQHSRDIPVLPRLADDEK